ncbi:hypothetical protein EV360DRAFT_81984 [Lentinula raphanica]|nr:hypothetical protein EV360DRAFT_81984 [Lentinula raphanica]
MAVSTTFIIIIVAVVTVLLLLLVSYIFWSKSNRKVPLPPVQPLAHDRERSLHAFAAEKERERSMFLQIEIAPSWSEQGLIKSAVSTESASTVNTLGYPPLPSIPPGISPVKRQAPPKPLSLASSVHTSRSNLSRGIPHASDSNVQIVLPAPLGASMMDKSRTSVADGWASQVINNGQPIQPHARSRPQSLPKSHTRSSSSGPSYNHSRPSRPNPNPPDSFVRNRSRTNSLSHPPSLNQSRSIPRMSSQYPSSITQTSPPPVPRIPSMYGQPVFSSSLSTSSQSHEVVVEQGSRQRVPRQGRPSDLMKQNPSERRKERSRSRDLGHDADGPNWLD